LRAFWRRDHGKSAGRTRPGLVSARASAAWAIRRTTRIWSTWWLQRRIATHIYPYFPARECAKTVNCRNCCASRLRLCRLHRQSRDMLRVAMSIRCVRHRCHAHRTKTGACSREPVPVTRWRESSGFGCGRAGQTRKASHGLQLSETVRRVDVPSDHQTRHSSCPAFFIDRLSGVFGRPLWRQYHLPDVSRRPRQGRRAGIRRRHRRRPKAPGRNQRRSRASPSLA